jgi:hypothetical protein
MAIVGFIRPADGAVFCVHCEKHRSVDYKAVDSEGEQFKDLTCLRCGRVVAKATVAGTPESDPSDDQGFAPDPDEISDQV